MSTEQRVRLGLAHLLGGAATFGPLTTEENLQAATCRYRPDDARRRVASAFDLFPELDVVRGAPARTLSGGQEQMLALAMALVHEPPILLIDELSLGLAPIVVERVLDVVRTMQAGGTSLVVVEQSLDIAVSIADRALFLERGRVRFDGSTAELMEREDLARSMFLGH